MKLLFTIVIAALTAGGLYYAISQRQPADVYALPVSDTYQRLRTADLMPGGKSFFGMMAFSSAGDGRDTVTWTGDYSHSHRSCKIDMAPWVEDPAKTKLVVTCAGGALSDGAAAGMAHNMFRAAVIEKIDSTLEGRPFDEQLARGSTASGWPDDGVDGSLATARKNAIEMSREAARMQNELKEQERAAKKQAEWDAFNGGPAADDFGQ
ncbi:hypothetical protein MB02_12895 [Croceicoccus estronivorus]|uniref:hypothetical protein n=1 Tax=Croceicoccus estronivorus TaxID=1172626 RepID=UPI000830300D|nr:hypothetical protein [Croceicoccus estronivorus]OCC23068.1 hypothetical protein MB02_12895 [Croceicoccus estronivorus]